MVAEFIGGM
jgi:broad specificity phosphatase PhoE